MEYKAFNSFDLLSDEDSVKKIKGYASVFGNIDSHGDIIVKGAFAKTIEDAQNRKIRLFSSHEMDAREMLGTITVLREDDYGLYFEADISSAPSAQDIAIKAKEGHLNEVSIGFYIRDDERSEENPAIRIIKEISLVEISLVSRASNPKAQLLEVKEENKQQFEKIEKKQTPIILNNKHVEADPELPAKSQIKESEKMTEENNQEDKLAKFMEQFGDKISKFEEILSQPQHKAPFDVEEKKEEVQVKSEDELKEEAMNLFVSHMKGDISAREYKREIETKALSSVVIENGGILVPSELYSQLLIARDRINKLESRCMVVNHVGPLDIADYSFTPVFADHNEGDTISETSISDIFGKSSLNPQDIALLFPVPKRLERRSFRSVIPLLAQKAAAAHNDRKEDKILLGTGNKEPLGVVTMLDSLAANTENITALANLDHAALVNVVFKLKEEYRNNAVFVMHPDAIATVMKITDSQGLPIWQHARQQDGQPARLLGYPVIECRALEDGNASGETPIVFGDFSGYMLQNELEFGVESSEHSNFAKNQIDLKMVVAYDGMPLDKDFFARIEIS